jgi:hypothetical protein
VILPEFIDGLDGFDAGFGEIGDVDTSSGIMSCPSTRWK